MVWPPRNIAGALHPTNPCSMSKIENSLMTENRATITTIDTVSGKFVQKQFRMP